MGLLLPLDAKIDPSRLLPSSSTFDWKLLGNVLDGQVQSYIKEMYCHGVAINTAVVMASAEGIVLHHDRNLQKWSHYNQQRLGEISSP